MDKEIYHALLDPDYHDVYVDADEIRTRKAPNGEEITCRYRHGGFRQKAVKFSIHFPKRDVFRGHFFQYLSPFPGPDEEMASMNKTGGDDVISFSLSNGAYFVESNMGSKNMFGPNGDDKDRWKSSAAVAEFSRKKAMEIYACPRPIGIVFGGSGGGYKTMACIENTDAWDGAVPYVIGSPVSLPPHRGQPDLSPLILILHLGQYCIMLPPSQRECCHNRCSPVPHRSPDLP
jgi:hypothetical protein